MKESKLFKSLVATFVVIVLSGPAVVQAAGTPSNFEDARAIVSYADLNLENEEGVRELYQRLQYASKEICIIIASPNTAESIIFNSSRRRATRSRAHRPRPDVRAAARRRHRHLPHAAHYRAPSPPRVRSITT